MVEIGVTWVHKHRTNSQHTWEYTIELEECEINLTKKEGRSEKHRLLLEPLIQYNIYPYRQELSLPRDVVSWLFSLD